MADENLAAWIASLRDAGRVRPFRRGERLFMEGFPRGSVLVVTKGVVRIEVTTADGAEVTLALRRAGDLIGNHSVLTGGSVAAGVIAVDDGEGVIVPGDRYLDALSRSPRFMMAELRLLVTMLHDAEARLVDIATIDIDARVRRLLVRLSREQTPPVRLLITQSDLASMVGASRASVGPVLDQLRERDAITTSRGEIVVRDPTLLT